MTAARALTLEELRAELAAMEQRLEAKLRAPQPRRTAPVVPGPRKPSDAARAKLAKISKRKPPPFTIAVSSREHNGPCVYVLLLGGVVVYVGKTRDGFCSRAADHFTDKRFDTIVTLDVDFASDDDLDAWLFALEEAACNVLRPTSNHRSALRGDPHRVAALACRIGNLDERIARACKDAPTPRYTPSAPIDLHAAMERE